MTIIILDVLFFCNEFCITARIHKLACIDANTRYAPLTFGRHVLDLVCAGVETIGIYVGYARKCTPFLDFSIQEIFESHISG